MSVLWFWARPDNNALAFSYLSSCDCFWFLELQLATLKREITCETVTSVGSFLCSPASVGSFLCSPHPHKRLETFLVNRNMI